MANLLRLSEIEREIAGGRFPNRTNLASLLEVSTKTIARDIETMRLQGAPIEFDVSENGYYFSDPGYQFSQLEIKAQEIFSLFLAERALEQYKETPVYGQLQKIFTRLKSYVPGQESIDTRFLSDKIIFHALPSVKINPETWGTVMAAIETETLLEITYQSPRQEKTRTIAPLFLINYQGQWVLLCYSETDKGYRNFALSRIRDIIPTKIEFDPSYKVNIKDETDNNFGIHFTAEHKTFVIDFDPSVEMIIKERRWTSDQTFSRADNGWLRMIFTSTCISDVINWVLQWGSKAKLIEPADCLETLRAETSAVAAMYEQ